MNAAAQHLPQVLRLRYGPTETLGWTPRLRQRYRYCSPDDWYEATLFGLVHEDTVWLDVGCGRRIFPTNPSAAKLLAERCGLLVGIDPSDNIFDNVFVHERVHSTLEDYTTDRRFDLITLRMVAEHVADPMAAVGALARLCKPGGIVVIYTVLKWSPMTVLSAVTPLKTHLRAKRLLWNTGQHDTFPTIYRMNTRTALNRLFAAHGFQEEGFRLLDDCRSFARWRLSHALELMAWKALRAVGLRYPEACILGQYRRL